MTIQCNCDNLSPDVRQYSLWHEEALLTKLDYVLFCILALSVLFLSTKWTIILGVLIVLRIFYRRGQVKEETLTVIKELGVQLGTRRYSGRKTHFFIDKTHIKNIIINEGIQTMDIISYMCFIVEGNDKMILAFQHIFPRLNTILPIYRGTRAIIFGEPEE